MPLLGYAASAYVQANLPRFPWFVPVTQSQIVALQNQIANIQSGALPVTGTNFRISGGLLGIKNSTTGLYNVPTTEGADGVQHEIFSDGQA